jgi:hypothetical protein
LFDTFVRKKRLRGKSFDVVGVVERTFAERKLPELPAPRVLATEQSTTSYVYGDVAVG